VEESSRDVRRWGGSHSGRQHPARLGEQPGGLKRERVLRKQLVIARPATQRRLNQDAGSHRDARIDRGYVW